MPLRTQIYHPHSRTVDDPRRYMTRRNLGDLKAVINDEEPFEAESRGFNTHQDYKSGFTIENNPHSLESQGSLASVHIIRHTAGDVSERIILNLRTIGRSGAFVFEPLKCGLIVPNSTNPNHSQVLHPTSQLVLGACVGIPNGFNHIDPEVLRYASEKLLREGCWCALKKDVADPLLAIANSKRHLVVIGMYGINQ